MELTELQIQIMMIGADKTLSFGCLIADKNHRSNSEEWVIMQVVGYNDKVESGYSPMLYWQLPYAHYTQERTGTNHIFNERMNYRFKNENTGDMRYEVIGHPITYSRLLYLYWTDEGDPDYPHEIEEHFESNPHLMNESLLERDEKTQLLVRDFLLSL